MKRLIAAAVLLIAVGISFFSEFFFVNKYCDKTNQLLSECVNAYNSGENGYEKTQQLRKYWREKEPIISVFANHKAIDDIELSLSSLLSYSTTEEKDLFNEYADRIKTLIHELKEDTKLSLHSVM